MQIPLTKGAYRIDGERAVNVYPVLNAAKRTHEFFGTEGLELFANLVGSAIRGLYVATNDDTKMYVVAGNKFFKVLTDGSYTQNAVLLNSSQGPVEFSDNGIEITITDGTDGYVYTIGTEILAKITDPDFPGGGSNTFLDGYTIVVKPNDDQVNCSDLYNSTAWDALDFDNAMGSPDNLVRCIEYNQMLWLFGVISTEPWYNDNGAGFPFSRYSGAVLGFGLAAKHSLAKNDQALFFLARTRSADGEKVIVEVRGYQPQIISTEGINKLLASLTNTANAEGFAYMREGHSFYELTFPSDNITIVYDAKERLWHERSSTDSNGNPIRHRARCYAYFNGYHMVGDFESGKVYKLKADVFTENGTTIRRKLVTSELTDTVNNSKFSIMQLVVPMKVGVGNASTDLREEVSYAEGSGSADGTLEAGSLAASGGPILIMRYSKDGGMTWSNEKQANFGRLGEYIKRVIFRRLGQARRFNVELSVSDAVQVRFTGPLIIPQK